MKCLNKLKYEDLKILAEKKAKGIVTRNVGMQKGVKSYYNNLRNKLDNDSYKSYLNAPCKTKEDLFKIAGMAYSWMPTMLDLYYDDKTNWKSILEHINKLKKDDESVREELVYNLAMIINHSIVGASKTLHIINPEFAPFIDSRVVRGWNSFFKFEIKNKQINKLPVLSFDKNNGSQLSKKVKAYINYWNALLSWKNELNNAVSLRDLEVLFYIIGEPERK